MSPRLLRWVLTSGAILGLLLLVGCGPTLDPSLLPPILDQPIYNCAQTIAFCGADRDAKIAVYVVVFSIWRYATLFCS